MKISYDAEVDALTRCVDGNGVLGKILADDLSDPRQPPVRACHRNRHRNRATTPLKNSLAQMT